MATVNDFSNGTGSKVRGKQCLKSTFFHENVKSNIGFNLSENVICVPLNFKTVQHNALNIFRFQLHMINP